VTAASRVRAGIGGAPTWVGWPEVALGRGGTDVGCCIGGIGLRCRAALAVSDGMTTVKTVQDEVVGARVKFRAAVLNNMFIGYA
jgi:hypothetical protein